MRNKSKILKKMYEKIKKNKNRNGGVNSIKGVQELKETEIGLRNRLGNWALRK